MAVPARWLSVCLAIFGFFSFPQKILAASVVIDKFSSNNGTDWVQVHNTSGETVDLGEYHLEDGSSSGNAKPLDCLLKEGGDYVTDWSNILNNSGDTIKLFFRQEIVDCVAYGSAAPCPEKESVDLAVLDSGNYGKRDSGGWLQTADSNKGDNSSCLESPPSPETTLSPRPESNPTAEYKINEVKDEDGNTLSSTKIYVDGKYTHHYAPEIIEFCDGCYCYQEVACGFGEHTIKLTKTGYEPWSETKTFSAGNSFEANPVLKTSEEEGEEGENTFPSQTPQTLGATTTTSKSPTKTYSKETASSDDMLFREATFTGEILGATESGEEKPEEKPENMGEKKNKDWLVPLGLSGGGLVLLSTAAFPFVKPRLSKFLSRFLKKSQPVDE